MDVRARTTELPRHVGDILDQANGIKTIGDISLVRSGRDTALGHFHEALALYAQIPEPYSTGTTQRRLARISEDEERAAHVEAARAAGLSIKREDLVAELDAAF